jgi:hypothetical protein
VPKQDNIEPKIARKKERKKEKKKEKIESIAKIENVFVDISPLAKTSLFKRLGKYKFVTKLNFKRVTDAYHEASS